MYKKCKKLVSLIFVMICVFTLFGPVTFATEIPDVTDDGIMNEIDKTNNYVYKTVEKTEVKAEKEVLKASQNIQKEESLSDSIDKLCDQLISKTEKEVDKLIGKAAEDGIEIIRSYDTVVIGGRTIQVDPCYAH